MRPRLVQGAWGPAWRRQPALHAQISSLANAHLPCTARLPRPACPRAQFNLSDFTRRAYGTNYVETLRVQIHANCRIRRVYFSERRGWALPRA